MRKVVNINRTKDVINITAEEIRKGEWLEYLPNDIDQFEFEFKNNYLTIRTMKSLRKAKVEKMEE